MLGRQHSAVHRRRCQRAGNQPLAASVRHQAAAGREVAVARRRDAGDHRAAVRLRRRTEGCCGGCGGCRCGCCRRCAVRPVRLRRLVRLRPGAAAALRLQRVLRLRRRARRRLPVAATRRSKPGAGCRVMRLFVGLGNPGAKYANNRHNIGFMVVDEIARRHGFAPWRRRFQGETSEGTLERERVMLLKPTDLHERVRARGAGSREFLQARRRRASPCFRTNSNCRRRKLRVKVGGGIAGHNGLRSISSHIGNDYRRVRLGIGHPGVKELVHSHVLSDFAKSDRPWVEALCEAVADNAGLLATDRDFDVSEQGASGDAGQGIFRKGDDDGWPRNAPPPSCRACPGHPRLHATDGKKDVDARHERRA